MAITPFSSPYDGYTVCCSSKQCHHQRQAGVSFQDRLLGIEAQYEVVARPVSDTADMATSFTVNVVRRYNLSQHLNISKMISRHPLRRNHLCLNVNLRQHHLEACLKHDLPLSGERDSRHFFNAATCHTMSLHALIFFDGRRFCNQGFFAMDVKPPK
jgi:hypothetical protein